MNTVSPANCKVIAIYTVVFACRWRNKYRRCEETFGLAVQPAHIDDWEHLVPLFERILEADKRDEDEGFGLGYRSATVKQITRRDIAGQPKGVQVFNEADFPDE